MDESSILRDRYRFTRLPKLRQSASFGQIKNHVKAAFRLSMKIRGAALGLGAVCDLRFTANLTTTNCELNVLVSSLTETRIFVYGNLTILAVRLIIVA